MAYVKTAAGRVVDPVTGGIRRRQAGWGGLGQFGAVEEMTPLEALSLDVSGREELLDPVGFTDPDTGELYSTGQLPEYDSDLDAAGLQDVEQTSTAYSPKQAAKAAMLTAIEEAQVVASIDGGAESSGGSVSPSFATAGAGLGPSQGGNVVYTIPWQGSDPLQEDPGAGDLGGGDSYTDITVQGPEREERGFGLVEAVLLAGLGFLLTRAYSDRKRGR